MKEEEDFVTAEDFAHDLGCTPSYIRNLCAKGRIEGAKKVDGQWRIPLGATIQKKQTKERSTN